MSAAADSAFIGNLGPREKSFWRFLATVVLGLIALVLATAAAFFLVLYAYVPIFHWPSDWAGLRVRFVELLQSGGRAGLGTSLQIMGMVLATNIVPIFAFAAVAAALGPRSFRAICTAAPRFRWRVLAAGFVLASVIISPFLLLDAFLDPKAGPPPLLIVSPLVGGRLLYAVVCSLVLLPAAMGEEILFRGWLLRQMSNVTRRWAPLMLANGVLFAAAHGDFAPEDFLERWIMGAGFTYMALRLGGVEFSSGVHFANNVVIVLFIEPATAILKPAPSALDPAALAGCVGLFVGYVALAEIAARWRALRDWSGAGEALAPSPLRLARSF